MEQSPDDVEARFLATIDARPDDDGSRVVYADWLEEQGRAVEAEFVRVQLEVKAIVDPADPRLATLGGRLREIAARPELGAGFRRAISRPAIEGCNANGARAEVRFAFTCPAAWDAMQPTEEKDVRFCGACSKRVHYTTDIRAAQRLAWRGECIAVDIAVPRSKNDLMPPMMTAGAPMPMPPPPPEPSRAK